MDFAALATELLYVTAGIILLWVCGDSKVKQYKPNVYNLQDYRNKKSLE